MRSSRSQFATHLIALLSVVLMMSFIAPRARAQEEKRAEKEAVEKQKKDDEAKKQEADRSKQDEPKNPQEAKKPEAAKKTEEPKRPEPMSAPTFAGLRLRSIGPAFTSGRVAAFAVDPKDHSHYFVASASGGVWKTENGGTTFRPVFDGEGSYSIGWIMLDQKNPLTVWVGTGENNSQRSVSY